MKISIPIDSAIAKSLRESVSSDPKVVRNGIFEGFSIFNYYADMMILTTTTGYKSRQPAIKCNLKISTREILTHAIEETWLQNREDKPGVPHAAIILLSPSEEETHMTYCTDSDAEQWAIEDKDLPQLREELRSDFISPPSN
ncbi:MAG: hypothetical protein WAW85_16640 [Gordonia sp. (in: high G+C Gram-positive bacteria)]|uniref:hypothetical protein n=1 Tax=Gordonia sp. (in: high G+C Gram-positive bacteria) TaxID=84139 RepID=UPI003BB52759